MAGVAWRGAAHTHTHRAHLSRSPSGLFCSRRPSLLLGTATEPCVCCYRLFCCSTSGPIVQHKHTVPYTMLVSCFRFPNTRAAAPKCGPPLAGNRGAASPLHEAQLFKLFSRSLLLRSFYRLRLCWALARCRLALRGLQWVQPGTIPRTCPLFYLLCHCVAVPQNDVHPCLTGR